MPEFVIALSAQTKENAHHFVKRLLAIIRATVFNNLAENLKVTVSIGMHPVTTEESIDQALAFANKLLYEAKRKGRDRIEIR